MLTAAIAFDDLNVRDAAAIDTIAEIITHHPDRGPFVVAVDRATGQERALRLMMECARWPDDARGTLFDHPTWHYADRPIATEGAHAPDATSGQAIEALQLNFLEASDPKAPASDRAQALCWVMHLTGDIHQPLHTASIYSKTYPQGTREERSSSSRIRTPNRWRACTGSGMTVSRRVRMFTPFNRQQQTSRNGMGAIRSTN